MTMTTTQSLDLPDIDEQWTSFADVSWPEDLFDERVNEQELNEKSEEIDIQLPPRRRPFRRPRAGRACGSCHARRIRCDAGSHGLPCTNCTAHSATCFIPLKKKKMSGRSAISEISRKHRGRYTTTKPWLENPPLSTPSSSSSLAIAISASNPSPVATAEITANLLTLTDTTLFTGLYASIALQNNETCFSRLNPLATVTLGTTQCIQNISSRISSEYSKNVVSDGSVNVSVGEDWDWEREGDVGLELEFCEEGEGEGRKCDWLDRVVVGTKVAVPSGRNVEEWFM
ncbi:hypothetical protein VTL71DRAFT_2808 [Oculimacula yallundae]|uniref:Zn(2)-C6 fungal-type domain-containing protein n=1 Tax=Oculimacula yallundae TaxID=86028 RepID=A0ABR4CBU1_9HELO